MAKLILDIDPQTIEHITQIADQKHLSVSAIAEKLFNNAVEEEFRMTIGEEQAEKEIAEADSSFLEKIKRLTIPNEIREVSGTVKVPDDFDADKARYEYFKEKYDL